MTPRPLVNGHPPAPKRRRADAWQRREALVAALLGGATVGEAAALIGVRRTTASGWLSESDVRELLDCERAALSRVTRDATAALHREAVAIALVGLRQNRDLTDALAVLRLTLPATSREADRPTEDPLVAAHDPGLDAELQLLLDNHALGARAEGFEDARRVLALLVRSGELPEGVLDALDQPSDVARGRGWRRAHA